MKLSKMWLRTKVFFARNLYIVGLLWWKYWSKLYRATQDDYDYIKLPTAWDPHSAGNVLAALRWRPDGGKELWDVCRSPHWVEFCLQSVEQGYDQPQGALDCDEFAIWSVHVLAQRYMPHMLTTSWVNESTKEVLGHALCIGRNKDGRLFHLGNWGYHPGFADLRELCEDVLAKTGCEEFVAWGLLDDKLTTLAWGRHLPKGPEFYDALKGKKSW